MHKLIEYVCDELDELEHKAEKDGKLSMAEVQYMDTLAHTKKNLLKADEMMEEGGYSMGDGSYRSYTEGNYTRNSYARGGRGNVGGSSYAKRRGANQYGSYAMGGYSGADDFRMELQDLIEDAPNEQIKRKMRELMNEM